MADVGTVTRELLVSGYGDLDEQRLADRLCRACVTGLDVDGAAVSLLTDRTDRLTLAATDTVAEQLEDIQFTVSDGICMEAARTGYPVSVSDMREREAASRWPLFVSAVLERTPVAALFAFPLQWGVVNLGVLDLYRTTAGPLNDEQWRDAAAAVDIATLLMLDRRTHRGHRAGDHLGNVVVPQIDAAVQGDDDSDRWLTQVTGRQVEIHQATGMVQVQLGVAGVDALARMRAHAFAQQLLLVDVAQDVVERRLVFTEEML